MEAHQISALRFTIGAFLLTALAVQVAFTPLAARSLASSYPEVAYLAVPYTIAIGATFIGFDVALIAGWRILTLLQRGTPALDQSSTWTNAATVALVFAASVLAGVFGHCAFIANVGGPPVLLGLIVSVSIGVSAPSLRRRVRGLLERAFLHPARPAGTETLRS